VRLERPNGGRDENPDNDASIARAVEPHVLPGVLQLHVETPGFGRAAENSYTVSDRDGRVVAHRDSFMDNTTYRDRIELQPGAYVLDFLDSAEDGLIRHWWLRGTAPDSIGSNGALMLLGANGDTLLDIGYDFAEKRSVRFFVGDPR
jgi:hypothetical protein